MAKRYDFKKEWPEIKTRLVKLSQEALALAKKGEKEIRHVSKQGMVHIDVAALTLKKEHLYHHIGKEYMKAKCPSTPSAQLKKYVDEVVKIDREIKALERLARQQKQKR